MTHEQALKNVQMTKTKSRRICLSKIPVISVFKNQAIVLT
jgi:hypothetical protein